MGDREPITKRLDDVLSTATSLLKQEGPTAARDALWLANQLAEAIPEFKAQTLELANLTERAQQFLDETEAQAKELGARIEATWDGIQPSSVDAEGAVPIAEQLNSALRRLDRSIPDDAEDLADVASDMVDRTDTLLDLSAALQDAEDSDEAVDVEQAAPAARKRFPNGQAEAGVHVHNLEREHGETKLDGAHLHLFMVPDDLELENGDVLPAGSILPTLEDGEHKHGLVEDSSQTGDEVADHRHIVVLPDGTELITAQDGKHTHDLQVLSTAFDGAHQHTLSLPGGREVRTLSAEEFWMLAGMPKGERNPPAPPASELAKVRKRMVLPGIIVSPPKVAAAIRDGDRRMLVKPRAHDIGQRIAVLVSRRKAFAIVRMSDRRVLDPETFEKLSGRHGMSVEDRSKLWPSSETVFGWDVEVLERFDPPRPTDVARGSKVVVPSVRLLGAETLGTSIEQVSYELVSKGLSVGQTDDGWAVLRADGGAVEAFAGDGAQERAEGALRRQEALRQRELREKAEPPTGTLPGLKVPDPAFLVTRMKADQPAGLVSRREQGERIGEPQALVNELEPLGFDKAFVWAVVTQRDPMPITSLAELTEEQREGLDKFTREEFAAESDVFYLPLVLVSDFDPPLELQRPPEGRRFASEVDFENDVVGRRDVEQQLALDVTEKAVHGFVRNPPSVEQLREMSDSELRSVDGQLHELFERAFAGNDRNTAEGVSREDVVNAHAFVLDALRDRDVETEESDALAEETLRLRTAKQSQGPSGKYADVLPSGERAHPDKPLSLKEVLPHFQKPMKLRMPAVYLVGSVCNQGKSENDVDLLIRGPFDEDTLHAIKTRIGRSLPPEVSQRLDFHRDDLGGPIANHVPLFDLMLVPHDDRELKEMNLAKQDDPLLEYPEKPEKRDAVFQYHFRGATLHGDLRLAVNEEHLVGWTMLLQKSGEVPSVDTIGKAREIASAFDRDGGKFNKGFVLPDRIRAVTKKRQPHVWLEIDGRKFEPGEVGASKNEPGVIVAVKRPSAEWGLQKPFSHEYFLTGADGFSGILFFRQLVDDRSDERFWIAGFTKSLLPSVIKPSSVEEGEGSMPPVGHSAMPKTLMDATPKEHRFWEADSMSEAVKMRDALVEADVFTEDNVVLDGNEFRLSKRSVFIPAPDPSEPVAKQAEVDFTLSWQYWQGPEATRRGEVSKQVHHVILEQPDGGGVWDFVLQVDPLSGTKSIGARFEEATNDELLDFDGEVGPGSDVGGLAENDAKELTSFVSIQDSGTAEVIQDQKWFKEVRFKGDKLKGIWTFVAEEEGSDLWLVTPGSDPGRAIPGVDKVAKQSQTRDDGTQVWDPDDVSPDDDKGGDRANLRPPAVFTPMKPAERDGNSFREIEVAANSVFTDDVVEAGVQVDPKLNGFRLVAEHWDADVADEVDEGGAMLFTEDEQENFVDQLPGLMEELEAIGGNFVLDAEGMAVDGEGNFVPRRELAEFRGAGEVDDEHFRLVVFDALYLDGPGNITQRSQDERRELLEEWFRSKVESAGGKRLLLADKKVVRSREKLVDALTWAQEQKGSEGAMIKALGSTYSLGGENDLWAKVRTVRQVRALVVDRDEVEGSSGVFTFDGAVGPIAESDRDKFEEVVEHDGKLWVRIGTTGNRKLDANVGDTIVVDVFEFLWKETADGVRLRWFGPAQAVETTDVAPMTVKEVETLLHDREVEVAKSEDVVKSERPIRLLKRDDTRSQLEEHYVFGVVLVPNEPDAQGDIYDEEQVRNAAHSFLEFFGGNIKIMHEGRPVTDIKVLESYVSKQSETHGGETFPKGTWFLATRVNDPELWEAVKRGSFTGYSMGGTAVRERL